MSGPPEKAKRRATSKLIHSLLSNSPDALPYFGTFLNKVVFNIVMFHQLHGKADRACFEHVCRHALEDTFKWKSRSKGTVARPSDQSYQEAFCAHLTENYEPFASLSTKDQFLIILMTETEVPVFLEIKINNIPGRSIRLLEDRKLKFIELGEERILPSDINHGTLEKFFNSGVLGSHRGSAQKQPLANTSPPPAVNQTEPIVLIKEEVEDEQEKQPKPEPEIKSQPKSEPKPTQAQKDNRFTPYPSRNPQNKAAIQNEAIIRPEQKLSIEKKPNGLKSEKSANNATPASVLQALTSSGLNQRKIAETTGRASTKQFAQKFPNFVNFSTPPIRRLPSTSQPDINSYNQVGGPANLHPASLSSPAPVDRENREVTTIPSLVLQGLYSTPPIQVPAVTPLWFQGLSPPSRAGPAPLTAQAISPIPTTPAVSGSELRMKLTTMPSKMALSTSSPMLPTRKSYPTYIKKMHLLETLQAVAQYANLTQLQKDVEEDLVHIGLEHVIDVERVLVNLQVTITNLGMFSKNGTEGSDLMKYSKAFMLILYFAKQFDPLRHLASDGKVEKAKEENMESVIAVKEVEYQLNNLRRIFAYV
ncbi:unnamed protein product [Caenorhabditis nigoni]